MSKSLLNKVIFCLFFNKCIKEIISETKENHKRYESTPLENMLIIYKQEKDNSYSTLGFAKWPDAHGPKCTGYKQIMVPIFFTGTTLH